MIYFITIIGIFTADLLIKNKVEKIPEENVFKPKCGKLFQIGKYHNKGAALNIGSKIRPFVAFVSLVFTLLLFFLFCFILQEKGNMLLKTGFSFLLGGAFSNSYDRLKRKHVVDYVIIGPPRVRAVVYNISDFFIIAGAVLLVLAAL